MSREFFKQQEKNRWLEKLQRKTMYIFEGYEQELATGMIPRQPLKKFSDFLYYI